MNDIDFDRLCAIGWQPALLPVWEAFLHSAAARRAPPDLRPMRLVELGRDALRIDDGTTLRTARLSSRLRRALDDAPEALSVGDWLLCAPSADGDWWAHQRLPPQRCIVRRDADGRRHAVVSHVDTALIVMGLDGDFQPRRLERFLLLVPPDVQPVVVLTKADLLAEDTRLRDAIVADETDALRARLGADLPVVAIDATAPAAALQLAPWLRPSRTLVLLGSSGAGKSTLTNTLAARSLQDCGPVRAGDQRGRHTTTARTLHRLPSGACVIDTPGLRALRPDLAVDTLAERYDDIVRLAPHCRFRDCRHGDEPGCAVRAALAPDRLRNFHKLQRELRRDTLSALERREQRAQWRARGRAGVERARLKRGTG